MSRKVQNRVALVFVIVSTFFAAPLSSEPVRFSRLLNQQPELLRFTSISNLGPASSVFDQQNFQNLYNAPAAPSSSNNEEDSQVVNSQQFLHRSDNDDDSRLITEPQPGQEYVQIHQQLKQQEQQQGDSSDSDDSISRESSITSINQKPISGRKPLALLRQSAGNKLNISPVFPGSASVRRNVTTTNPLGGGSTDEEYEGVTTEFVPRGHDAGDDEVVSATTYPPTVTEKSKKDRMVINVVTSAPRIVFDDNNTTTTLTAAASTTTTTEGTTLAAATTTTRPPTTPVLAEQPSSSTTSRTSKGLGDDDENLVVDAFHRNGHFPDFEDSPAHLHTAESSQPARVNVRPASSGKDYEYEYIYYYYDDEDDDNSTSKSKAPSSSAAADTSVKSPATADVVASQEFSAEKIGVVKPQTNSIEVPVARSPKVFPKTAEIAAPSSSAVPQTQESQEELVQVTTVLPEILKTRQPNSINRPVVLKQSNLNLLHASVETPLAITERPKFVPTTTPTTTTVAASAPTESPRARIRSKSRTEAPAVNQFTRPNEDVAAESVEAPPRRPAYKDSSRRRNPASSRRLQQQQQQQQEASTVEQQQPAQASEEPARVLPGRTRFPPRQTTQANAVVPEVVTEQSAVPAAPVQLEAASVQQQQSLESSQASLDLAAVNDRKAKDNFARQKSINDLYALTRLHQLAINTRVPNRVQPKVGGFVNSAEQTTKYYADDASGSSEATTLANSFPSAISAEAVPASVASAVPTTEQIVPQTTGTTTTTTTTTEASLAQNNDRFAAGKARNRFRQRGNRLNGADGTSSTTETASRAPANPNRFAGRRRPFASTTAASPSDAEVGNVESVGVRPVKQQQQPARNRFAGRTRPTTSSTTTEANDAAGGEGVEQGEIQHERVQPQRRRPNFQGRRRNQQLQAAPQTENAGGDQSQTTVAAAARGNSVENERRRFNFGNAARTRPNGPRPLVRGRPSSTTEAAAAEAIVSPSQNPEPIVSEQVSVSEQQSEQYQAEKPSTQQQQEDPAPIVSISSTTSSSVSTDTVVHKKGSAGVLGRLRSRTKPVSTTTTVAPEVTVAERKPSRLSGILNRRKVTAPGTSTSNPVKEDVQEIPQSPELEELQRKGVVVQVSSTVTESEEIGEQPEIEVENSSSSTHASILNRVKSQRKPGSIYRKSSSSHSSE